MVLATTSDIAESTPAQMGRILIVENSQFYTSLIKGAVKNVFSGPVDAANNFDDVKKFTSENRHEYFLALLNLSLPGASFGEAVAYIRSLDIPAVVFTSSIEKDIVRRIKSYGVIDYILKENVANLELVSRTVRRLDHNRRIKVLVADDSATIRSQMRLLLEHHLFNVDEARDGLEALEMIKENPEYRLLVTDYNMPNLTGFELIKELRTFKNSRELAIVGMSGQSNNSVAANFIRFGADDFVTKPINQEEFSTRISMCMDKMDMLNELMFRATTDFLTKLWNRRYFMNAAKPLYSSATRNQISITVAMIDLDFFKNINDTYGHEAGDEVLRTIGARLKSQIRETDLLARMGGEEFCLLAVNVDPDFRDDFLSNILSIISSIQFNFGGETVSITASMGVTVAIGVSLEDMLNRADAALYSAKNAGRDQFLYAE